MRNVHLHNGGIGGSVDFIFGGNGGDGWDDCKDVRKAGGTGGLGGAAFGGAGVGGPGMMPGAPGAVTVGMIGNGGDGGDGEPPGSGGPTGEDKIAPVANRADIGTNFTAGALGAPCPEPAAPLCDPEQSPQTEPTKQVGQAVLGDSEALCSVATDQVHEGPTEGSGDVHGTKDRALDHTSTHSRGALRVALSTVQAQMLDTAYPCGDGYTLCGSGAAGFPGAPASVPPPAGDYYFVFNVMHDVIPTADPVNFYQYGFVFDRDGDTANNFVPNPAFPKDFFQNTDFWIEALYDPATGWSLKASNANGTDITETTTAARLLMVDNVWVLVIPVSEFSTDMPPYRLTTFRHDGNFGFNGNWDGDVQPPVDQPLLTLPE